MSRLDESERAHVAALQSLASHLADVSAGEPIQRESVSDLLAEIDGNGAIDDDTLDRIARRGKYSTRDTLTQIGPLVPCGVVK